MRQISTLDVALGRGETRTLRPTFQPTARRTTSYVLFGVGGAAPITGVTFGALALGQESRALHQFDEPSVREQLPERERARPRGSPRFAVVAPSAGEGLAFSASF